MKTFVCVVLLAALVAAEPPRYRQRFRIIREEAEESGHESRSGKLEHESPYPASGFKPSRKFELPARQEIPPSTLYGTPDDSYRAPLHTYVALPSEYGLPMVRRSEFEGGEEKEENSDSESSEKSEGESSSSEEESSEEGEEGEKGEKEEKEEKHEKSEKREKGRKKEKSERKEKGEKKEKENLEDDSEDNDDIVKAQGAYYVLLPGAGLQRVQFQTQNDINNMAYTARLQYRNEEAPVYVYTAVPQYQPTSSAYTYYSW